MITQTTFMEMSILIYGDVDIELVKGYCEYVEKLLSEICCDDIDFF